MASSRSGNTFYVDSASSASTPASFISQKNIKVRAIVFTSSAAGDALTLCDLDSSTQNSAGPKKIDVKNINATDSKQLAFNEGTVLTFSNGIWVSSISSGASACIITESS